MRSILLNLDSTCCIYNPFIHLTKSYNTTHGHRCSQSSGSLSDDDIPSMHGTFRPLSSLPIRLTQWQRMSSVPLASLRISRSNWRENERSHQPISAIACHSNPAPSSSDSLSAIHIRLLDNVFIYLSSSFPFLTTHPTRHTSQSKSRYLI